jgi:hypothetical protein
MITGGRKTGEEKKKTKDGKGNEYQKRKQKTKTRRVVEEKRSVKQE